MNRFSISIDIRCLTWPKVIATKQNWAASHLHILLQTVNRSENRIVTFQQPLFYTHWLLTWGLHSRDQWFWQNFIISMCGIKFWKGNENLRSVYKKPFFEILSGFFLFSQKGFNVPSKNGDFSLMNRSNGVSKNSAFRTDFRNVHVTLVKNAQKKSFILSKKLFHQL